MTSPQNALKDLWALLSGPSEALDAVDLQGGEPVLPSSFHVATAAQASIAAAALAANELWALGHDRRQEIAVGRRHAAIEFRSERYLRVNGVSPPSPWDELAGVYQTGDGRWVRVHTNFKHHRDGLLTLLNCAATRAAVQEALLGWDGEGFETAMAERGLVASLMRSPEVWAAHDQGKAIAALPLLQFERIGEAPPQELPYGERPLSGVRVLDLTRIIAGPVCGRTLAAHGAEVLRITGPHLPFIPVLIRDSGRGKRSAHLDLRQESERACFRDLLRSADVLVQGYRPGAIAGHGFSPEVAAALRPGIVYVSLSAYGHTGPWADRRGFDSLVQTASGINHAEAEAAGVEGPKELPCQALDHASGHLMACAAMMALRRRALEGGSWHVRVSLAQTGRWLERLGRLSDGFETSDPAANEIEDLLEESDSGFGRLTAVRHAAQFSETPPRYAEPAVPLGTHPPKWLSEV